MKYTILLFALLLLCGCKDNETIEGLWIVKSVVVGNKEVTPNARWMRFNADLTQESGNGLFQHSYGNWKLNKLNKKLTITNTNGLEDLNEPFKVTVNNDKMVWNRIEEGQKLTVNLIKTNKLPETYGDKLLGLWKLEKTTGKGIYFDKLNKKETNDYVHFRWDKRFTVNTKEGRKSGIYNVHGHKPELELIPYEDKNKRSFWKIQFSANTITLKLLNTDSLVTRTFKRIYQFP